MRTCRKYLPLWEKCVPPEFKDAHKWDYSKFTRGERFVYQPIPRAEFDETLEQVKRWDLDQYLKEKSFEKLTYRVYGRLRAVALVLHALAEPRGFVRVAALEPVHARRPRRARSRGAGAAAAPDAPPRGTAAWPRPRRSGWRRACPTASPALRRRQKATRATSDGAPGSISSNAKVSLSRTILKEVRMDAAGDKLMKELREVVAAAEELLSAATPSAEQMKEIRDRAEEALRGARERLEGAGDEIEERVRKHPFAALGIAAAVGPGRRHPAEPQMTAGLLQSAQDFVARLLDLGRTRFELFGTELREELAHLATTVVGGLAVLVLAALGLAFCGLALIFFVSEANRLAATIGVAVFFFLAAGVVAWVAAPRQRTPSRARSTPRSPSCGATWTPSSREQARAGAGRAPPRARGALVRAARGARRRRRAAGAQVRGARPRRRPGAALSGAWPRSPSARSRSSARAGSSTSPRARPRCTRSSGASHSSFISMRTGPARRRGLHRLRHDEDPFRTQRPCSQAAHRAPRPRAACPKPRARRAQA